MSVCIAFTSQAIPAVLSNGGERNGTTFNSGIQR